ncbi:Fe2+-dependent dioxygenase [Halioxenophilus aromaticivorans]|uniref:Fe2+-dependent dioxygenase n=1 Tax=Halioxenophilus aromaticivorans TaxID=1306992 RepID=A0AAV3TZ43_9ALTE
MLIPIKNVLNHNEIQQAQQWLEAGRWQDGKATAGGIAAQVKNNLQLDDQCQQAKQLQQLIVARLNQCPQFIAAALPAKLYPPKFNCYQNGGHYGAHVDGSIMTLPDQSQLRTDVSCTLFLTEPGDYAGGELCIEGQYGLQEVKLSAGDLILYPATSLHQVKPVTEGKRVCAFFWAQSLVKNSEQRSHLYDLDNTIQSLTHQLGANHSDIIALSGLYHNLVRQWTTT